MNELMNLVREIVPVTVQIEIGAAVSAIGVVGSVMLGWDNGVQLLVCAMIIDYVSGMLAAYISPDLSLNSQRGFRGICKKMMILLLVSLAHLIDSDGSFGVHSAVAWFFVGNEGLSILENAAKSGVPIPAKLKDTLEQLSSEKKERNDEK